MTATPEMRPLTELERAHQRLAAMVVIMRLISDDDRPPEVGYSEYLRRCANGIEESLSVLIPPMREVA